jgi:two-component system phosphate regulon sensor histidine kinase PhoR
MNAQAKRMNHLINGLLSLSRIEMDQYIMPNTPCDVIKILNDVSLAMQPLLINKNMNIIKLYDVSDAMIYGDTGQIFQVFQNLVENAIKYSPSDTDITLNCVLKDNFWHISVTDMGMGIPENHIPRLIERFYRIDDARHRSQGGAGLGLSIVSKIIDRHKGRLEIQSVTDADKNSNKKNGSSFHVFLPVFYKKKEGEF